MTFKSTTLGELQVPDQLATSPFPAPKHHRVSVEELNRRLIVQLDKSNPKTVYALKVNSNPTATVLPVALEDFLAYTSLDLNAPKITAQVCSAQFRGTETYFEPEVIHAYVQLAEQISSQYNIRTFFVLATSFTREAKHVVTWQCDPGKEGKLGNWFPTPRSQVSAIAHFKGTALPTLKLPVILPAVKPKALPATSTPKPLTSTPATLPALPVTSSEFI